MATARDNKRPWGAHMSIAGGMANAIERGATVGCNAIQVFTKNNNRWIGKPLDDDDVARFKELSAEKNVKAVASHDCYLINLASPDKELHKKSCDAFLDEIDRANALDIPYLVFHPGAHMGEGEAKGIAKVAKSVDQALEKRPDSKTIMTIETTAGQGTSLGYRFEHIRDIIGASKYPERFGVCVDTCHIFAAGYEINTEEGYQRAFKDFQKQIGTRHIKMFHVNDSKKELGSRVDRHDHIGKGHIGLEGFRYLVNDKRFIKTPLILETPKGADNAEDVTNLATLESLIET